MHLITKKRLTDFWTLHSDSKTGLIIWNKFVSCSQWQNFVELRKTFPSADQVGNFTVFNISGNKYRLIALVDYKYQKVFIRYILTHSEYDKGNWKKDNWY